MANQTFAAPDEDSLVFNYNGSSSSDYESDNPEVPAFMEIEKKNCAKVELQQKTAETYGTSMSPSSNTEELPMAYTMDRLLSEQKSAAEVAELNEMEDFLKNAMKIGFTTYVNEHRILQDDQLDHEYSNKLEQFQCADTQIVPKPPGVCKFKKELFKQLYGTASRDGLQSGPFNSVIDKHLATLPTDALYEMFISRATLVASFHRITDQHALLSYMFTLLSIHNKELLVDNVYKFICHILRTRNTQTQWVPTLNDLISVLINYGTSLEEMCGDVVLRKLDINPAIKVPVHSMNTKMGPSQPDTATHTSSDAHCEGFSVMNLEYVILTMIDSIMLHPTQYSDDELLIMIVIAFNLSLEERLTPGQIHWNITYWVSSMLDALSDDAIKQKSDSMCNVLATLTTHHHNQAALLQIFPPTTLGITLRRQTSYKMAVNLVCQQQGCTLTSEQCGEFTIYNLAILSQSLQLDLENDLYLCNSIVKMFDAAVGDEPINVKDKDNLTYLVDVFKAMIRNVKETMFKIDKSTVKNQVTHLVTKWAFMLKPLLSKQSSLFTYQQSPNVVIEELANKEQDDSEMST